MAVIRVGGSTEVEVKERKDRVDDAMHATRAAVLEGIVPGGGVALLRAKAAIGKLTDEVADVQAGINIVLNAIEAPIRQIVANAGGEGAVVVGKILANKSQTYGFDAQSEQYVDMLGAGIVDPAKVVRVALQDAASVAGLLITTEAMITDRPKKARPRCRAAAEWAAWAAWIIDPTTFDMRGGGESRLPVLRFGAGQTRYWASSRGARRRLKKARISSRAASMGWPASSLKWTVTTLCGVLT